MELQRRHFLALGTAGAAGLATGLSPAGPATAAHPVRPAPAGPTATQTLLLSGADKDHAVAWEFMVTAGRNANVWSTIPVPSNWDFHGFGTYTSGWTLVPEERGLYRHTFTAPAWAGRRTYIVFEGSMTDTTVTVNGQLAGPTHQGGFYRFRYDVTDLLKYGESNLLEVTVLRDSTDESVNRAERLGDYWNFGGIYRPVYLESHPAEHIDRVAIDAEANGAFTVDVFLGGVTTADRVVAQITNLDGTPVGEPFSVAVTAAAESVRLATTVPGARQWSEEFPNLYRVDVRLFAGEQEAHRTTERFGFRTIEVRQSDGIYINGRKIRFKGANRHIIWPDSGRAVTEAETRLDLTLMKQMNMNAVRCSHYPPDVHMLDLCDELGLYVIDELAGWQKAYTEAQAIPKVRSMVIRDVNHPSVVFWANGNEWGHQHAVVDDYAIYDPQNRPVIHPINAPVVFNGIKTHHYLTYQGTVDAVSGPAILMSTEMLHALYDGGAGAALNDFWEVMGNAPLSAGGFIWALVDEGIIRDDRGGAMDVNPNYYPDGILGPYREKEGSFYTIKEIWSPIQLTDRRYMEEVFPTGFTGAIRITNRYDFTNTNQCRFSWQLVNFFEPDDADGRDRREHRGHRIAARADIASPDIAPGASGELRLRLPTSWRRNDALILIARHPSGDEIYRWSFPITSAAEHARQIVAPARRGRGVTATEDAAGITMRAGRTSITIDRTTGRLAGVVAGDRPVSLRNGPAPANGTATLTGLTAAADGSAYGVSATYQGSMTSVRWLLHANGWLQLDYEYNLTGSFEFLGVNFDYPEANVRGMTWLGQGPFRVWKNRMRGFPIDVYSKAYNDTATGSDLWEYPEFKGFHANTYWATLRTTEVPITIVAGNEDLFLRLFTPRWGPGAQSAVAAFPTGDISFLDAISAMGYKFQAAANLGPESQPTVAAGPYRRTMYLRFG
ncbi:MAG TPA: glycoside hydrolase family 2 TIM barrel-domain containing protein [Micromonosporaceae bacterium]|nr:glycoside hydrolase family 2 TIM barrel-domain containing protein [Micromonosporaceae bacterium]